MFNFKRSLYFLFLFAHVLTSNAQERLLTAGFQYKPIIPTRFFNAGPINGSDSLYTAEISTRLGHSFGMVIRRGITKSISYETAINLTRKNYLFTAAETWEGTTSTSEFGITTYEIPQQCLIYIQLGQQLYMNNAFGISLNAIASDVESYADNRRFYQISIQNSSAFYFALLANIGFEYRTKKSGFYYLGASLHRPLSPIMNTFTEYERNNFETYRVPFQLTGTFLTVDLRYFFHEQPVKARKKKKSGE